MATNTIAEQLMHKYPHLLERVPCNDPAHSFCVRKPDLTNAARVAPNPPLWNYVQDVITLGSGNLTIHSIDSPTKRVAPYVPSQPQSQVTFHPPTPSSQNLVSPVRVSQDSFRTLPAAASPIQYQLPVITLKPVRDAEIQCDRGQEEKPPMTERAIPEETLPDLQELRQMVQDIDSRASKLTANKLHGMESSTLIAKMAVSLQHFVSESMKTIKEIPLDSPERSPSKKAAAIPFKSFSSQNIAVDYGAMSPVQDSRKLNINRVPLWKLTAKKSEMQGSRRGTAENLKTAKKMLVKTSSGHEADCARLMTPASSEDAQHPIKSSSISHFKEARLIPPDETKRRLEEFYRKMTSYNSSSTGSDYGPSPKRGTHRPQLSNFAKAK